MESDLKISTCQLNDTYFPLIDGIGITSHNYAHWLNKKYGKSILVAPKVKDFKDHSEYKVYRFKSILQPGINPYRKGFPLVDIKFKKSLKEMKFDILHAHSPFISGHIALNLSKKLHIPLVASFHSKYRNDFQKLPSKDLVINIMMDMTIDFYNAASLVWVPNKATGASLKEYGYNGLLEIMPTGTDFQIPGKPEHMKYRKKGLEMINSSADEFIMLFVGEHRWEKNLRLVLDAMRVLNVNKFKFSMVFAGDGCASKEMIKLVRQYHLKEKVKFLGLISDREKLKCVYAASDLLLFPSVNDYSQMVIQEAAAFSIPSIVIKNSPSTDGIIDGVNGFIIDNETESLVSKISDLYKHQEIIRKAGIGAKQSLFRSWETIIHDVYQRYCDLINNRHLYFPKL